MSQKDVAKAATRSCGSTFYFVKKSKNRLVESNAVSVEALNLSREEPCTKSKKSDGKLIVRGGLVQRERCEVHQR